jgi:hypothetical protein
VAKSADLTRDAIDLVLKDIASVMGPDAVRVVMPEEPGAQDLLLAENPSLLEHLTDGRWRREEFFEGTDIWVYVPGESSSSGTRIPEGEPYPEVIERVADRVQETLVESRAHFGECFPTCPKHGEHPMWAEVRDEQAIWVCHSDREFVIPIGSFRPS